MLFIVWSGHLVGGSMVQQKKTMYEIQSFAASSALVFVVIFRGWNVNVSY